MAIVPSRRRRGRGAREGAAGPPDLARALAEAARRAWLRLTGGRGEAPAPFEIELRATVVPGEPWTLRAERSPEEQILAAVRELAARKEAFQPGRVWCYRCESAQCAHSQPEAPTRVFGGYASTGLPQWPEFSQVLLERRHPKVETLFDPARRELLAAVVDTESLRHRQLDVFGRESKTYDILAQAIFGLVYCRPEGNADALAAPEPVAFTLQAVESRRADGVPRVRLNVLARLGDGSPALEALSTPHQLRVLNIVSTARRRTEGLTASSLAPRRRSAHTPPDETAARAARILHEAVRALSRLGRQAGRRTAHAEGRGLEQRPTSQALADAAAAAAESLFWDSRRRTVVVLGPHHRVHVFSPEGRHVTSLRLEKPAVERRRRRERWEPLTADQLAAWRGALARRPREAQAKNGH